MGVHTHADMGFGYRAKFIVNTVATLKEKGDDDTTPEEWLMRLRDGERDAVQEALLEFTGVGRKVADCVALFSLDQTDCIPVDTHVWQIAVRDYDPTLKEAKSLTPAIYNRVGDLFRDRYGTYAGRSVPCFCFHPPTHSLTHSLTHVNSSLPTTSNEIGVSGLFNS